MKIWECKDCGHKNDSRKFIHPNDGLYCPECSSDLIKLGEERLCEACNLPLKENRDKLARFCLRDECNNKRTKEWSDKYKSSQRRLFCGGKEHPKIRVSDLNKIINYLEEGLEGTSVEFCEEHGEGAYKGHKECLRMLREIIKSKKLPNEIQHNNYA